jgi:hypothetical protein
VGVGDGEVAMPPILAASDPRAMISASAMPSNISAALLPRGVDETIGLVGIEERGEERRSARGIGFCMGDDMVMQRMMRDEGDLERFICVRDLRVLGFCR